MCWVIVNNFNVSSTKTSMNESISQWSSAINERRNLHNDLLYICLFFFYVCLILPLYITLYIDCGLSGLLELDLSSAGALFTPNLLTTGSPMQQRRDSILKQQGSVKSEKRVSIKPTPSGSNLASLNINNNNNNNNAKMQPNVEYISEAASSSKGARLTTKPPAGEFEL